MSYSSPVNYHRHQCHFCGFVWEHHDCNDTSHGDYGAHECPACHRCNWSLGIYTGSEPPKIRNGRADPEGVTGLPIHPDQQKESSL